MCICLGISSVNAVPLDLSLPAGTIPGANSQHPQLFDGTFADAEAAAGGRTPLRTQANVAALGRDLHPSLRLRPFEPDARGLRRDTQYFLGYQFAVIGLLYAMPEGVSGWSSEQKEARNITKWWDNVREPAWDKDRHYINYIGHPYWGAAYYVRAKERGYDGAAAFWYSVLLSTLFEFGAEAIFEQPSIQDLIVTPVFGSLVGIHFMEWRDQTRARMLASGEVRIRDRAVMGFTDPLGTINRWTDKRLGRDFDTRLRPFLSLSPEKRGNVADPRRADMSSGIPATHTAKSFEPSFVAGLRLRLYF